MKKFPLYEGYRQLRDMKDFLSFVAETHQDKPALSYRIKPLDKESQVITFKDLEKLVKAYATECYAKGMSGKHCILLGKLTLEWALTYFALMSIGAVVIPLDKEWLKEDLAATIAQSDASYLFCDSDMSEKVAYILENTELDTPIYLQNDESEDCVHAMIKAGQAKRDEGNADYENAEIDPNALALMVYTSGTTGQGKGVMLSQNNLFSDIWGALQILKAGEKSIAVLPPHHTFGSTIGVLALLYYGAHVYLSSGVRYLLNEMKAEKPDFMILVPLYLETFARKIKTALHEKGVEKLILGMMKVTRVFQKLGIRSVTKLYRSVMEAFGSNLKLVACGGAPLSEDIIAFFDALGVKILNGYGITECSPLISCNRNCNRVKHSVGDYLPCDTVKIESPNENGEGEICVKGPNVMLGYYKNPTATAEAIDQDGFFHTGDMGKMDKNGHLFITGRIKNLIILSNGKNVYPEEIETELGTIRGVLDVVVYEGVSRRGIAHNAIVAEFFMDEDYLKKKNITNPAAYLAPYITEYNKTAVQYKKIGITKIRTEEFPKNTLRKILRFKLDKTID